jgi:biopolymer transport protein ExbD
MRRVATRNWAVVELTPLVDVVFLLVIFFLVAADATRLSRPPANLVAGPGEASVGTEWDVVLTLGADGRWRTSVGGSPLSDDAPGSIEPDSRVLLRVDRSAPAVALTSMAEHLRVAGVHRVDLALGEDASP